MRFSEVIEAFEDGGILIADMFEEKIADALVRLMQSGT